MPKIRFTDVSTGTTQDVDAALPIDATPFGGSAATVRPKVYRTTAAPTVVLPPVNQSPPAIAGTPAVSSVLSLAGFDWDGAGSFSYRWLADGVLVGSAATYTAQTGDQGKTISAEMQGIGGGASSGWVAATNVVFIPIVALAVVTADEWETYEAVADADTRKAFMRVNDTPTAGFEFGFWRSATPGPEDVTLTSLGAFTFVTDHYEALSSGQNPIGTPSARSTQYVRIAERNIADPTNTALWRWVSETKTYLSSSTPAAPIVSVTQGTGVGEIIVNITTVADPSDRAVTSYEYRVDGAGSWLALGGGLGVGPRSILGFTPLQSYSFEVRAVNANGTGLIASAGATLAGNPPVLPDPITTLVFGSQQFELDGAYTVITHIDGAKCIVSASPVTIQSKTPAIVPTAGAVRNGAMKNPPRGYQAFDQRIGQMDATKLVSFPLSLSPNDILLSAVSMPETGVEGTRCGYVDSYDMVYVAASAPDPLSLAPTVTPWTGRTTLTAGPVIDYTALAATMPTTYDATGVTYRTIAQADRALRFNPIYGLTFKANSAFPDAGYEPMFPNWWGSPSGKDINTTTGNYGQWVNARISDWCWQLCAPTASVSVATKANLLMRICSFAWQTWQGWANNNTQPPRTGEGHQQMHHAAFNLLYYLTGNTTGMDEFRTKFSGVWNCFFYMTEDMIPEWFGPWGDPDDPYSMFDFPYPAHYFRRKITAVDAVAKTITVPTYVNISGIYGASTKERWANLIVWRESDGANAVCTGPDTDWNAWPGNVTKPGVKTLTLATWPGFAVDDIIYAKAPWTPVVGDPDWRKALGQNEYNASGAMAYRNQAMVLAQLAFLRVLGLHRVDWQPMWDYALYADNASTPTAGNDFPRCYEPTRNFAKIWAAHKATILAVAQPNLP